MLYAIDNPATAANSAILLHPDDSAAIARVPLRAGQTAQDVTVLSDIPAGHKLAIREIAVGQPVYRYGNLIGFATAAIHPGQHIHTHNLSYEELDTRSFEIPVRPARTQKTSTKSFQGYRRPDGRIGTRNYLAVVAASNCAAYTANLIADSFRDEPLPSNVDGVVAFPHGDGCGQAMGQDTNQLQRTLEGSSERSRRPHPRLRLRSKPDRPLPRPPVSK
jgi:altronate hydrolase